MSTHSQGQTALLLGATGFLGRYIARYLTEQGWRVLGVGRTTPENAPLANLTTYHRLSLPHPHLRELLRVEQPQVCIHSVGRASVGLSITDPKSDFYEGPVVTFEVLDALRQTIPTCRMVFLSSAAVYGNPTLLPVSEQQIPTPLSPYGFHKWQSEQLCLEFSQLYGLPTASVRIFSAYGPGLRRQVMWDICQKALTQSSLKLQGTGSESRDFIHGWDVARAIALVLHQAPMQGEVYNLAGGTQVAIADLAQKLLTALDCPIQPEFDGKIPLGTPRQWQADISKLHTLGFSPSIPLSKGISSVAQWCRMELLGV